MEIGKFYQSEHFFFQQPISSILLMGREMDYGFESYINQNTDHYRGQLDHVKQRHGFIFIHFIKNDPGLIHKPE